METPSSVRASRQSCSRVQPGHTDASPLLRHIYDANVIGDRVVTLLSQHRGQRRLAGCDLAAKRDGAPLMTTTLACNGTGSR